LCIGGQGSLKVARYLKAVNLSFSTISIKYQVNEAFIKLFLDHI